MKPGKLAALAALWAAASVTPTVAHHSFAMFDNTKEVTVVGTVKEFQWTNPHSWLQVNVPGADGKMVEWSFEGGSPGILSRNGWKRTSVKPGDKVTVIFYPLKDGKPGGSFLEVKAPDGKTYYYHG